MNDGAPRVLVIRGGAIGDFILTLPAVRLLREGIPDVRIEILGYAPILELAKAAGIAESTRSIEHAALASFFIPGGGLDPGWSGYFASFDVVVSYLFDPDGFFHANLKRAGVETVVECSHRVDASLGSPAASQLARPLESLAMFLDDPAPRITVDAPPSDPPPAGAPSVGVHPGSGSASKNWGYENWAAVCRSLHDRFPTSRFLITSGEAESGTIRDFIDLLDKGGVPFHHVDSIPLPELAADLAGADLFLGHDSGISHLAAATGVPCLLVFGPTDPAIWAPQNRGVRVIAAPEGNLDALGNDQVTRGAIEILSGAEHHESS